MLFSNAVVLLWLCAALDISNLANAQTSEPTKSATWYGFRSALGTPPPITAEDAHGLERRLQVDPKDEEARSGLLSYYWHNQMHRQRIQLVFWLIEHQPESALHGYEIASIFPRGPGGANVSDFASARQLWLAQVRRHAQDVRVLGNAARALNEATVWEGIDLFKRARKLDSTHRTDSLAKLYSLLLLWNHEHGTTRTNLKDRSIAAQVRRELLGSTDVSLVGKVARDLLEEATRISMVSSDNWDLLALKLAATELVTHVSSLEPDNRAWADLMEGAKPCQLQQSSI